MKELFNIWTIKKASPPNLKKFEATSLVENYPQIKNHFCSNPPPPTVPSTLLPSTPFCKYFKNAMYKGREGGFPFWNNPLKGRGGSPGYCMSPFLSECDLLNVSLVKSPI